MWKCKHCQNDATHINVCDDHYFCNVCESKPPVEAYFSENKIWCMECWNKYVAETIIEWEKKGNHKSYYEHDAICPYCGKKVPDSWELKDGDDVMCSRCENVFEVSSIITVEYSTRKKETHEQTDY